MNFDFDYNDINLIWNSIMFAHNQLNTLVEESFNKNELEKVAQLQQQRIGYETILIDIIEKLKEETTPKAEAQEGEQVDANN